MKKRFPDEEDWRRDAVARLRKWGFNLLGAGSSDDLRHRGLLHTVFLSMGDTWAYDKNEDMWICPNEGAPCTAFPNVFHPDWRRHCEEIAAKQCAPNRDDPWLFGYFIDNELAWWGRSSEWGTSGTGLFDEAMKRRAGHPAREAARALAERAGVKEGERVPDEVKLAFLRRAAELYFEGACAAIRRADPNHLVMGARFAGVSGANPVVWEVSGRHCDLVTFNCYPWADIDRNIVYNDAWGRRDPVGEAFARVYSLVKKPLLVTEWSFPALDSGLPCTKGAGQRFPTQKGRTAATELFAKTMLSMPFVIGYDYFMWVDEPALGISRTFPENTNYGLINEKGDAYPEITSMFENLHRDIAKWRRSPPPETKPAPKRPFGVFTVDTDVNAYGVMRGFAPGVRREGDSFVLERPKGSPSGLVLRGRIGGKSAVDEISYDGAKYGSLGVMLALEKDDGIAWCGAGGVESFEVDEKFCRVTVKVRGAQDGFEYEAELEIGVNRGYFASLKRVVNTGAKPLAIRNVFFRQGTEGMGDVAAVEEVPLLWNASARAAWVSQDGRFHGAHSLSRLARNFTYWSDAHGQHPDAWFDPEWREDGSRAPLVLAPGATWDPKGEIYIVGSVGPGGTDAWREISRRASLHQ